MVVVELAIIALVHLVLAVGAIFGIRVTQSILAEEPGPTEHESHAGPEEESTVNEPSEAA